MNINLNKIVQKIIPLGYIVLIAYLLNTILLLSLPLLGVDYTNKADNSLVYRNYNGFYSSVKKEVIQKKRVRKVVKKEAKTLLSSYTLTAIYSTLENKGWISIDNKRSKKTYILAHEEQLDGYTLEKLFRNYVLFEKDGKEFRLEIRSKSDKKNINYEITNNVDDIKENVVVQADSISIKRNYLNTYVSDIDKVWKDISIKEIRKNGVIDGFKVYRVARKSIFSKLGLKAGDVIKSINNTSLKSYADAFNVYNNISKLEYLSLEILRNNEIMELNYEID